MKIIQLKSIIIFAVLILLPSKSMACREGGYQGDYQKGMFNKFSLVDHSIKLRCRNNTYNNLMSNICY